MNKAPVINLSISSTLNIHYKRFAAFISKTVTPEEALAETLQEFANEIAVQREDTKDAWAEMAKYLHPEKGTGVVADLKERLEKYNSEGARDGAEMMEIQDRETAGTSQRGDKARKAALQSELQKDAANVKAVTDQLAGAEALLKQWTERYDERDARLQEMKDEFAALEAEGPAWLAQIRDSQKAEDAADNDAKKGKNTVTSARNLRAELKGKAEMSTLREEAGRHVDAEEPTLDEELAARERVQAGNELISGWLKR